MNYTKIKKQKWTFLSGICLLVLVVLFQNCSDINLQDITSQQTACKEKYRIASVREADSVRFFVLDPNQNPVSESFVWSIGTGKSEVFSERNSQISVLNTELTSCVRYTATIDRVSNCSPPDIVQTDYVHGTNCDVVVDPPDEDPPEDPEIEYDGNYCPITPIPQDTACEEVPSENHNGMTVAVDRQLTGEVLDRSLIYRIPVVSYYQVFSTLGQPGHFETCGLNCGTPQEGFGFPSFFGNNFTLRIEAGKFIALKFRVPTGQLWHHMQNDIRSYSAGGTFPPSASIARCPGQFRSTAQRPLPPQCAKQLNEAGTIIHWEIVPPGGTPRAPYSCPLEAGQTYYMNFIHSNIEDPSVNLAEPTACNENMFVRPGICGARLNTNSSSFMFTNPDGSTTFGCRPTPP